MELLVVILILAILMSVALPLYLDSLTNTSRRACRANMHSIANAAQAWKVRQRYPNFNSLNIATDLAGDLGSGLSCPDAGTYSQILPGDSGDDGTGNTVTVAADGFGVQCSVPNHGAFVPGVQRD